jgi:hypothetical protein
MNVPLGIEHWLVGVELEVRERCRRFAELAGGLQAELTVADVLRLLPA